jgi:hypothetical protein
LDYEPLQETPQTSEQGLQALLGKPVTVQGASGLPDAGDWLVICHDAAPVFLISL